MKRTACILTLISVLFVLAGCAAPVITPTQDGPVTDTTLPVPINLTKATPDNNNTPTFTWNVPSADNLGIASYQVRIGSDIFIDIGNVTTYTVAAPLPDGSHTFEVRAVSKAGNKGTAGFLAFTIDTAPPAISGINSSDVTEASAIIIWITDEPATSQVEYGTTTACGLTSPLDAALVTNRCITLTGLASGTTYHYRVRSTDAAGNEAVSDSYTLSTAQVTALGTLTVHFIDVGQGDSILIDFGDIEVLIDGGDKSADVVSYIDDYVDGALEVIVATHPHADHIGSLIDVLAAFEVQEIWLNGDTSTSKTYSQFMSAVKFEGAQVYEARRGDTIEVGDLVFNVLHPVNLTDTTNNNSIVLSLSYGEVAFLFTADAEQEAEASMLAQGIVADVEILKVGHHGSRSASSPSFLAVAQPEVAIYMAGVDNRYGHPHEETISALQAVGALIYGTDANGTIVVSTDGQTYTIQTEK